ncbi:hypothetical protein [Streptosporangium sp. NPDC003464]
MEAAVVAQQARLRELDAQHTPALRERIAVGAAQLRLLTELRDGLLERSAERADERTEATDQRAAAAATERQALREVREHAEARVATEKDADQARAERDTLRAEAD